MRAVLLSLALAWHPGAATAAPAGEWRFDEGQGEVSKGAGVAGRDALLTGVAWAEGAHGRALEFKGPDHSGPYPPPGSFARIAGSEDLNPKRKLEISVAVFPTAYPVAWGGIVEKGAGYGSSYRLLLLRDGKVRAAIGNEHLTVDSPAPLKLNAWTRLSLAFDGKTLRLVIDGKGVAQAPAPIRSLASSAPIEFGRRFTGRIDEVKLSQD